jgi:hypothetical protein
MRETVDISGIDKGVLLAELFNRSAGPMGLGLLQASAGPDAMTHDQGRELIAKAQAGQSEADHARMFGLDQGLYFDYLYGRPLKVNLDDDQVDPWGYDRDNGGPGTFASIVAALRESQGVA